MTKQPLAVGIRSLLTGGAAVEELSGFLHDSWVDPPLSGELCDAAFRLVVERIGYESGRGPKLLRSYPYVPALLEVAPVEHVGSLVSSIRPLFKSRPAERPGEPEPPEPDMLLALELDPEARVLRFLLSRHQFDVRLSARSGLTLRDTGQRSSRRLRDLGGSIDAGWIESFRRRYAL